ncbi:MAG: NAD(P)(+) transhydrogenase (Re/Si-specific) subunit beta [Eubacteriales bacterium]|nr:NAD(P)(+) transhydrogenase (Re/Si-specific) subunit beta [Clostridiales bacterium]MDY5835525.1 NAD(P)(+) transhydrogenase (Re/Si-specific) subunit beta [Eubacteriales bacterium]
MNFLQALCFNPLFLEVTRSTGENTRYRLISLGLIALVLIGISLMSKVERALIGNRLGALAMLAAVVLTLYYYGIFSVSLLWVGLLLGGFLGLVLARKVQMIQMPQMVGLLNGFGGLASMLAGILTLMGYSLNPSGMAMDTTFATITGGLAVVVGGLTWTGSAVAAGKLHRIIDQKPKVYPGHQVWTSMSLLLALLSALLLTLPTFASGTGRTLLILLAVIFGNLFGYFLAIRVGGADMPITISLLNSFSGVAGAIAGMAVADILLVAVGGIVGASGLILTQIMCKAMNRQLLDILVGKSSAPTAAKQVSASAKQAPASGPASISPAQEGTDSNTQAQEQELAPEPEQEARQESGQKAEAEPEELAGPQLLGRWLEEAQTIIIVPGYGMALAQAQVQIKQLADQLEAAGKQVDFAIHPVAGRMPGHMNVLLAEVDIPYDKLHEMAEINDQFKTTDLCLVVGANDVINPAANTAEGTPIYGMPVLDVGDAKHIVICNYDLQPGYAGVPNPLYEEAEAQTDHVVLLLGDAKESLKGLQTGYTQAQKGSDQGAPADGSQMANSDSGQASSGQSPSPAAGPDLAANWLDEAHKVIIVPGYGMALAQAQAQIKQLTDQLEAAGKQVDFAIHPVAGRMPGHMNVLLAEVDIPYDKLHEMAEINDQFKTTDLCLVVGANDVINPAANTAEGTPIYGMPVLDVGDAKHVVICNFDLQPGYAGVPNPLYEEAQAESGHVILLLGDAKQSLADLLAKL